MTEYQEYHLTHWEEPEIFQRIMTKDGVVSVTPELVYNLLKSYFPIGYREGEITLDLSVAAFREFWKSLGGEMTRA